MPSFPDRYPTHLIDVLPLRGTERLTLRPILPQDDWLLAEMINAASPEARSLRLPSACEPVRAAQLQRLTCVDYDRHLALVVTRCGGEGDERIVAEGRYAIDPHSRRAEFTLMVDARWQRRGIGTRLLRALEAAALAAGATQLQCEVLCDHHAFLGLVKHCRFRCTTQEPDWRLVQVASRPQRLQTELSAQRPLRWLQRFGAWQADCV